MATPQRFVQLGAISLGLLAVAGFAAFAVNSGRREARAADQALLGALENFSTRLEALEVATAQPPVIVYPAGEGPTPGQGELAAARQLEPVQLAQDPTDAIAGAEPAQEPAVEPEPAPTFNYSPGALLFGYPLATPSRGDRSDRWGAWPTAEQPFLSAGLDTAESFSSVGMRAIPELRNLEGQPHGLLWKGYLHAKVPGNYAFFAEFDRSFRWGGAVVRLEGQQLFSHFDYDEGENVQLNAAIRPLEVGHHELQVWMPWAQGQNPSGNELRISWRKPYGIHPAPVTPQSLLQRDP